MDQAYLTALFALGGTLMGALASFAGIWLAQRQETNRAIRHELIAAATKCWEVRYFHSLNVTGKPLLPIDDYIIDFLTLEKILPRVNRMSDDELLAFMDLREDRFRKICALRNKQHRGSSAANVPPHETPSTPSPSSQGAASSPTDSAEDADAAWQEASRAVDPACVPLGDAAAACEDDSTGHMPHPPRRQQGR